MSNEAKPEGTLEASSGDYDLVRMSDGVYLIRCRRCGLSDAGGRKDIVMLWWVSMTGDQVPVHESCVTRKPS